MKLTRLCKNHIYPFRENLSGEINDFAIDGKRAGRDICGSEPITSMTAAAAAKSFQSCPTLCDPIDGSPPGSPVPGILQARTLEWVAISYWLYSPGASNFSSIKWNNNTCGSK